MFAILTSRICIFLQLHVPEQVQIYHSSEQESESIMQFFVPDGPEEEEDPASTGENYKQELFENAHLLDYTSFEASTSQGEKRRWRRRPEPEFGRAKLHPEGNM